MKMYTTPFSSSLHHRVAQLFIASAIMSIAPTPFFSQKIYAQTTAQSVSGTVIDKNNETLVGAIIKVLPNGDMTQTDAKGRFELKNLPANAKLQVSYLGMKTTTVSVDGKKELTILLENSDNNIGEVVVTGYQDVRRPRMTGSVSVIKSSDIAKMDVRSMDQVLRQLTMEDQALTLQYVFVEPTLSLEVQSQYGL